MRIRNIKNRDGLTLLFVVSMIVLFLLMGTTFVIISNDYFKAARVRSKAELYTIDRTALVHRAFYDVLRGPSLLDVNSPFRAQDILSDQYAYGFRAYINGEEDSATDDSEQPTGVAGNHFIRVTLRSDIDTAGAMDEAWELHRPDANTATSLTPATGLYNGLVFTFVSGPAKGASTRIVNHTFVPNSTTGGHHYFWIIPTWLDGGVVSVEQLIGSEVVVNGREFSGSGAGGDNSLNSSSSKLTAEALRPNRMGESFADLETDYFSSSTALPDGTIATFPNESYDAADYQNMFLSGRDNFGNIIPSFHRHSLYRYVYESSDMLTDIRRYSFRPVFRDADNDQIPDSGSTANAAFPYNRFFDNPRALLLDPQTPTPLPPGKAFLAEDLEVDTDGDGSNDAVFIDPGYGIITDHNGKQFKPLVAFQIVDLDGRLNLNAHGNLAQIPTYNNYIATYESLLRGVAPTTLPRGSGYGPPDVSLSGLLGTNYEQLLQSRYGPDRVPGDASRRDSLRKLYGYPVSVVNWQNRDFGTVSRTSATEPGSLFASSAMDVQGRFGMAFPAAAVVDSTDRWDDFRDLNFPTTTFTNGLPGIDMLASVITANEFDDNPYEMSFAPLPYGNPSDRPYSPAELERVLRQFDVDSNVLPNRLWNVANSTWTTGADSRNLVTTDSFEIPMIHENFKTTLIRRILVEEPSLVVVDDPERTLSNASVRADLMIGKHQMFAPELSRGLKMDVNRPLGNGYDDDGDGIVDEPDEAALEYDRDYSGQIFDLNRDGVRNASDANARELFARHLYMLALLLTDHIDVDLDGDGTADDSEYRQIIAQWAVNVVDFRDPDTIMTRFQYDDDPWDGSWDVSNTNTVWGCERPELLITETVAAHPRRTEDLSTPGDDVAGGDEHFDQRLRPEPFAYFELYNPWTQNSLNQKLDPSLYDTSTQGVDLARVTIGANGDRSPVWRISIDRPDRGGAAADARPLRFVYFTDPDVDSDAINDDDGANVEVFFPDSSWAPSPLRPGTQALIGTLGIEDPNNAGKYRSFMGRRSGKTQADEIANNLELDTTQHISIDPSNGEVIRYPVDMNIDPRYAVILPIDTARPGTKNSPTETRSFSVSDPFGGYPDVDASNLPFVEITDGDGYRYTDPYDIPLDHPSRATGDQNRNDLDMEAVLADEGMSSNFRTIKLQRLANPQMPWHDTDNPYLTIDVMEMDLIAFNGVSPTTPAAPEVVPAGTPDSAAALERGVQGIGPSNAQSEHRDLWRSERDAIANGTPLPGTDDHYYDFKLIESLGKTNDAFTNNQAVADGNGYSWLTWNNRPYISHLELTNVPYTEPEWLTRNFTTKDTTNPYNGFDETVRGRFHHLLNFFANDDDSGGDRANLYRLMDYLEVPSRFVGTDQQLNPANFLGPFDNISRYRVPGKINLNTIYCDDESDPSTSTIWDGLQGNYDTLGCNFQKFRQSREDRTGSMPTDFGNPFRPAGEGINVPPGVPSVTGPGTTLFRSDFGTQGATGDPLFDFDNTNAAYNSDRNAYFRNAQRQRLGNLVTNKSSVFAVWITVAYFEVDENGLVGAEVGSDTGEITRNRGFYIYDRSIPVAFEPGKNHNVERGILVQSIIE